jgi:hypothetical protein
MGSEMENPDLSPPPIYCRIFNVPKGGGKSGFYCIQENLLKFMYRMQYIGSKLIQKSLSFGHSYEFLHCL